MNLRIRSTVYSNPCPRPFPSQLSEVTRPDRPVQGSRAGRMPHPEVKPLKALEEQLKEVQKQQKEPALGAEDPGGWVSGPYG